MFAKESKRVRHFVGRCERGEDVHTALQSLATQHGIQAGWVRGAGRARVRGAARVRPGRTGVPPARCCFQAPLEVLSLTGNIASRDDQPFVHLHVTLSRETDNGIQLLGGHLERGRVFALEFHVEAFDDVALVRERDAATGLHLFVEATRGRGGRAPQLRHLRRQSATPSWSVRASVAERPCPMEAERPARAA
jgi:predicted DNA-binding protein with PD1-like motif